MTIKLILGVVALGLMALILGYFWVDNSRDDVVYNNRVMEQSYNYVILSAEHTVTQNEVDKIFEILEAARTTYNETAESFRQAKPLEEYVYQIIFNDPNNPNSVFIQAAPETVTEDPEWSLNQYHVRDGGNSYFNAKIDLTQNVATEFYVNGEA